MQMPSSQLESTGLLFPLQEDSQCKPIPTKSVSPSSSPRPKDTDDGQAPILTVTYRVFDVPVTTASGPECAQYIRRIVSIPQKKSPDEQALLLAKKLDEIRRERRQDLMPYIRSLTGEKYRATSKRKRKQASIDDSQPALAEEIALLLFTEDCLTEASDRRLLITITRLLHRKANVAMLKAAEDAINLIKRAKSQWECYTGYWTGETCTSAYKPGKGG